MAAQGGTVIVAVGDELLGGFTQDTNSSLIAARLRETAHPVRRIEVVSDTVGVIVEAVRRAVAEPEIDRIIVCGGVGPTPDDLTLEAVGIALGRPIRLDPDALDHISRMLARMHAAGWVTSAEVSQPNRRMAMLPAGAVRLENRRGMGPAIRIDLDGPTGERFLFVLPGVPRELRTVVDEELLPRHFAGGHGHTVELRYAHAIEAEYAPSMSLIAAEFPEVSIGSYPQTETRELVMRLRGNDSARVDAAAARFLELRPKP